jgi:hypothetical protein
VIALGRSAATQRRPRKTFQRHRRPDRALPVVENGTGMVVASSVPPQYSDAARSGTGLAAVVLSTRPCTSELAGASVTECSICTQPGYGHR